MHATTSGEVWRAGSAVLSGHVDLQSGPGGWRATVMADREVARITLPPGKYELRLADGAAHQVRFDTLRLATHEARFVGIGDPPAVIGPLPVVRRGRPPGG